MSSGIIPIRSGVAIKNTIAVCSYRIMNEARTVQKTRICQAGYYGWANSLRRQAIRRIKRRFASVITDMSEDRKRSITPERRKRINRLKKMIINMVLLMILIPVTCCIVLSIRVHGLKEEVRNMSAQIGSLEQALRQSEDAGARTEALLRINEEIRQEGEAEGQTGQTEASEEVSGNNTAENGLRKVYLTFDDGPSIYTAQILDILAEYDIKATFFVTGKDKEGYGDIYRRIVEEGHTLGMHSYSHAYADIYASLADFQQDLEKLRDFLYEETGTVSNYYRFPGGSSNQVSQTDIQDMITYLDAMDITYFDWNVSSGDASPAGSSSEQIVSRVMAELPSHHTAVVLMHDAAGKHSTVQALPELIEEIQSMDDHTVLLPITEETMPVQHVQNSKDNREP